MKKAITSITIYLRLVFFLFITTKGVIGQTPQAHLNPGIPSTGTTGTITINFSSVSANYTGSFTYNPANPTTSQTLFLNNLPAANDYTIKINNNTNRSVAYFVCQAPRGTCDPTLTRNIACEAVDNPTIDGTSSSIAAGTNNFIVAQNYKVISNAGNGNTCQSNAGTNYNYVTGAIYVNVFAIYANSLGLAPFSWTDGALYMSNSNCATKDKMHIWVNGKELTNYTVTFNGFGLFQITYPFGSIKAGDIVYATNDCGDTPSPYRIAGEVNYYIEVPNGVDYVGNGITQSDTLSPSGRLETPVEIKQCTEIPINSHFLANVFFGAFNNNDGSVNTSGKFLVNGQPISSNNFNLIKSRPAVSSTGTINGDGSISVQYDTYYLSNRQGGVPPYTLEYINNGINENTERTFRMNGVGYAFINNNTYSTWKYNYSDYTNHTFPAPTTTSSYKLQFNGNKVIWLVNNNKIDSVTYTVQYSIVGGNGTLSNTNAIEVGTPITFIPSDTGSYALQAKFSNGVIIQQKFHVTPNVPTIAPSLATIYSGNSISLVASGCNGTIHWGSANSTITGNVYQVSPLTTTTYTAFCETTTGCKTLGKDVTITVQAPKPTITPSAASVCAGAGVTLSASGCVGGTYTWTGGIVANSISVNPTSTTVYTATCTNAAGTSQPTPIKLTVN